MARHERRNVSLPPDVSDRLDEVPNGKRSETVAEALRDYFDDL